MKRITIILLIIIIAVSIGFWIKVVIDNEKPPVVDIPTPPPVEIKEPAENIDITISKTNTETQKIVY